MNKLFLLPLFLAAFFSSAQIEAVNPDHLWVEAPRPRSGPLPVQRLDLGNGVALDYVEQGRADGTPVILLHGFSDSWRSFETVLPHLPPSLHAFALSQRGHGGSSKEPASYNPQDFAADVAAFLRLKGIKKAVIVGHSMGSTVAQCLAVNYPGLVKALVLAGSFADYGKPVVSEFKAVIDALSDPVDSAFVAAFQKSTIGQPTPGLSFDTVVAESRRLPARVWKGVAAGWQHSDFRRALPAYTGPALIVWGDKDAYCPLADQRALRTALKRSRLVVYKDIGHAVHWEAPARFAADLSSFVHRLAGMRTG